MEQVKPEYGKRGYVYSFLFHCALLLLMLKISVLFEVEIPEFYELNLGALSQQRVEQILEEARRAEEAARLREEGMTPQQRIEVPERKMIEIEEPTISVPAEQRIESHDIITNAERQTFEVEAPEIALPDDDKSIFTMDRKESYQGSKIVVGEQPGAGIETTRFGSDMVDIVIDGEIENRSLFTPEPEYPEGLNKQAVIIIKITVLPDGSVSPAEMVTVRKENTVLEELSKNKLKTWRFRPLPEGQTQKQSGTVTFVYRVE